MKDLLKLAEKHKIERYLFYGDALDRIYKLMGDGRLTRWLDNAYDDKLEEKELWIKLIVFLQKKIRVQQQKMLIQGYKPEVKETNVPDKTSRYKNSYHSISPTIEEDLSCCICGEACTESEHTATAGPGCSKVIQ